MWTRLKQLQQEYDSCALTDADHTQLLDDLGMWHKQAISFARKQRAQDFQKEVEEACFTGDSHIARETLKKLRPWEPQARAQLQSLEGALLDPEAELQARTT